mgnify:CR=1 FL=1|jgi:hypothetical protein
MKNYYLDGIAEIKLANGQSVDVGKNPSGLLVYDEKGNIVGVSTYDNAVFYPVKGISKIRCSGDSSWYAPKALQDELSFNYDNVYKMQSYTKIND